MLVEIWPRSVEDPNYFFEDMLRRLNT